MSTARIWAFPKPDLSSQHWQGVEIFLTKALRTTTTETQRLNQDSLGAEVDRNLRAIPRRMWARPPDH